MKRSQAVIVGYSLWTLASVVAFAADQNASPVLTVAQDLSLKVSDSSPSKAADDKAAISPLSQDRMENFDAAFSAANEWIEANGIEATNVETVVLPNITLDRSEGTNDGRVETEEAMTSVNEWYQFLRVWYRK